MKIAGQIVLLLMLVACAVAIVDIFVEAFDPTEEQKERRWLTTMLIASGNIWRVK